MGITLHCVVELLNRGLDKKSSMKNLIKIFSAILIIVVAIVAINCSTSTHNDEATDSTAVEAVVDTTGVSGGAGVDTTQAIK